MKTVVLALIVIGILVVVLVYQVYRLYQKIAQLPTLKKDERIPVVGKGESNLTIIRKGANAVVSDEEGNIIPFKTEIQ